MKTVNTLAVLLCSFFLTSYSDDDVKHFSRRFGCHFDYIILVQGDCGRTFRELRRVCSNLGAKPFVPNSLDKSLALLGIAKHVREEAWYGKKPGQGKSNKCPTLKRGDTVLGSETNCKDWVKGFICTRPIIDGCLREVHGGVKVNATGHIV